MVPYNPAEPLAQLIEHLEKGRKVARVGEQTISDVMVVSKDVTLFA